MKFNCQSQLILMRNLPLRRRWRFKAKRPRRSRLLRRVSRSLQTSRSADLELVRSVRTPLIFPNASVSTRVCAGQACRKSEGATCCDEHGAALARSGQAR
jgi:hypothetical protein